MTNGRKPKYQEYVEPRLQEIRQWRMSGKTEPDIAKMLGIAYSSFKEYKNKYTALSAVLKEAKQLLVEDLEISLFELAKGGIKTKTTKRIFIKRGEELVLDRVEETEQVSLPSIPALVFSLKNLAPEKFQDKREYVNNADYTDNQESLLGKMREVLADSEEEVVPNE